MPIATDIKGRLPMGMRQFPLTLNRFLMREKKNMNFLLEAVKSKNGRATSYVHFLMTGEFIPSPLYTDRIADALKLNGDDRIALHRAAALDHGFKIGPPA